jgi:hypothetical protein
MEMSGQFHATAALIPGKEPGTHWIEDWVDPIVGMDAMGKTKNPFHTPVGNRITLIQPVT